MEGQGLLVEGERLGRIALPKGNAGEAVERLSLDGAIAPLAGNGQGCLEGRPRGGVLTLVPAHRADAEQGHALATAIV